MLQLGAIVRFLMLVACLVPFTSARQASVALAPYAPLTLVSPAGETPAPVREEDDERETDATERLTAQAKCRSPLCETVHNPPTYATHLNLPSSVRTRPPVAADTLRNGLGTHYRC